MEIFNRLALLPPILILGFLAILFIDEVALPMVATRKVQSHGIWRRFLVVQKSLLLRFAFLLIVGAFVFGGHQLNTDELITVT